MVRHTLKTLQQILRQPHKMVKHTQTIRRPLRANCLNVFDHFVGLALKELKIPSGTSLKVMSRKAKKNMSKQSDNYIMYFKTRIKVPLLSNNWNLNLQKYLTCKNYLGAKDLIDTLSYTNLKLLLAMLQISLDECFCNYCINTISFFCIEFHWLKLLHLDFHVKFSLRKLNFRKCFFWWLFSAHFQFS